MATLMSSRQEPHDCPPRWTPHTKDCFRRGSHQEAWLDTIPLLFHEVMVAWTRRDEQHSTPYCFASEDLFFDFLTFLEFALFLFAFFLCFCSVSSSSLDSSSECLSFCSSSLDSSSECLSFCLSFCLCCLCFFLLCVFLSLSLTLAIPLRQLFSSSSSLETNSSGFCSLKPLCPHLRCKWSWHVTEI